MRGDVTKLPKWAQAEISRLTRDLEYERARLAVGPEDSDTFADPYNHTPRPLGRGTSIQFVLEEGRGKTIHVRTTQRHDGTVRLDVVGGDMIIVHPQSGNHVEIGLGR